MTSTVMLAAVRTILDESSASFWTDNEIYAALADGQNEVINKLLSVYRAKRQIGPETLLPLELASISVRVVGFGAASAVALPVGFLELIAAKWDHDNSGGKIPCRIITPSEAHFMENNTYLVATSTDPVVWIAVDAGDGLPSIIFRPVYSTTGAYDIDYLDKPTDIASGVNAELPVNTHNAIVHFATSRMLYKDQRVEEAQIQYNLFLEQLKLMTGL